MRDTPRRERCGRKHTDLRRVSIPPFRFDSIATVNIREELSSTTAAKVPLLRSTAALLLPLPSLSTAEGYVFPANERVADGARTRDLRSHKFNVAQYTVLLDTSQSGVKISLLFLCRIRG